MSLEVGHYDSAVRQAAYFLELPTANKQFQALHQGSSEEAGDCMPWSASLDILKRLLTGSVSS